MKCPEQANPQNSKLPVARGDGALEKNGEWLLYDRYGFLFGEMQMVAHRIVLMVAQLFIPKSF